MLLFTGSSHFSSMKHDFVAMLPRPLPKDVRIIYLTGLTEIAGAIGMLIARTRRAAGLGLVIQLAAMFPANVNAALKGVRLRGKPPTALWLRAPMQLLYIGMIWWAAIGTNLHEQVKDRAAVSSRRDRVAAPAGANTG